MAPVINPLPSKYPPRLDGRVERHGALHPGTSLAAHLETVTENGRQVHLLKKERQALHDKIAMDHLAGIVPPSGRKPVYIFLGGGAASGKSTLVDSGRIADFPTTRKPDGSSPADAVLIDSDAIKQMLPDYASHDAAYTHNESYMIALRIAELAMERGLDIVMDGTGITDMEKKIDRAKKAGYTVRGVYVTSKLDTARKRAAARAGRSVPDHIVSRSHAVASQIVPRIASNFDSFELWDAEGSPVQVASSTAGGRMIVSDAALYSEFLKKAKG